MAGLPVYTLLPQPFCPSQNLAKQVTLGSPPHTIFPIQSPRSWFTKDPTTFHCLGLSHSKTSLIKSSSLTFRTCPPLSPSLHTYALPPPFPRHSLLLPKDSQGPSPLSLSHTRWSSHHFCLCFLNRWPLLPVRWTPITGCAMVSDDVKAPSYSHLLPIKNESNSPHQGLPNHTTNIALRVYIDSKYAFHSLLTHSAIWKEWGFLNTNGNSISKSSYIHNRFKASLLPCQIGLVHYKNTRLTPPLSVKAIIVLTWQSIKLPFPYDSISLQVTQLHNLDDSTPNCWPRVPLPSFTYGQTLAQTWGAKHHHSQRCIQRVCQWSVSLFIWRGQGRVIS